jgi:hypothetical protein
VLSRLLKNTHMFRCRSIASLQRTASTPSLVIFRAPRTWIFLSSLQEPFLNTLYEYPKTHVLDAASLLSCIVVRSSLPIYLCSVSRAINASSTADRMMSGA